MGGLSLYMQLGSSVVGKYDSRWLCVSLNIPSTGWLPSLCQCSSQAPTTIQLAHNHSIHGNAIKSRTQTNHQFYTHKINVKIGTLHWASYFCLTELQHVNWPGGGKLLVRMFQPRFALAGAVYMCDGVTSTLSTYIYWSGIAKLVYIISIYMCYTNQIALSQWRTLTLNDEISGRCHRVVWSRYHVGHRRELRTAFAWFSIQWVEPPLTPFQELSLRQVLEGKNSAI